MSSNLRESAKQARVALTEAYHEAGGNNYSELTRAVYAITGLLEKYEESKKKFRDGLSDPDLYRLWFVETYLAELISSGLSVEQALAKLSVDL